MSSYELVAAIAAVLISGCSPGASTDQLGAASTNQMPASATSLLERSIPADGARLLASPENLVLNFRTPVRLQEVTVLGADGQSVPMMITAAGLSRSFSIPMPDLEPGSYTVRWRAADETGGSHEGSLGFVLA